LSNSRKEIYLYDQGNNTGDDDGHDIVYWQQPECTGDVPGFIAISMEKSPAVFFAPNRNHPLFDSLHKALAAQKQEVEERNLVIFNILESGPSNMNTKYLDPQTAQSLRKKFDVPWGKFAVILIGKDGGIKLNRQDRTHLEHIFALIDSMPLRQDEMRQKS
jgi:hypothetical protein